MKWSVKIAQFKGIPVYIHATFMLILGWVALTHWLRDRDILMAAQGVFFILLLFLCVVLHEYGHALAAIRYGIKTRDITLYPIGGVAKLERMPDKPGQELVVALAGPAVNVVIAAILFVILMLTKTLQPLSALSVTGGSLLERLMVVNIFLVAFNLLPAFPMDGLAKFGQDAQVKVVMDTYFQNAEASEMLQHAMARLQACQCRIMPVLRNGKLSGLLTMENIGEFMMIHTALQHSRA
ncbi:hypothetical protein EH223_00425 [candidate division KSB1 bacterium]|nr:M50 family metallopeptidase [candidate division KSB1 bacterium]RQW07116.1 MAG: hypothetical protein EH223_00425 [candidate division KSB1 bacterium]